MKSFYVGGPVNPDIHYVVDRSDQVQSIVAQMLEGEFLLLHSHRQAGKTSMIKPIVDSLADSGCVAICVSLESLLGDESTFWSELYSLMKMVYSGIVKFSNSTEFLLSLSSANFEGKRVFLILDEIDRLLEIPRVRDCFLSALRAIKTVNGMRTSNRQQYALTSVLGIGVFHILSLGNTLDSNSPFNISNAVRLAQPSLDGVVKMISMYGNDIGVDLTKFAEDIFGRSSGHLGFTSLLGKVLMSWVQTVGSDNITIGGWVAHLTFTSDYVHLLFESSTVRCIRDALRSSSAEVKAFVMRLLHCHETAKESPQSSVEERDIVDYLETQGVVVRETATLSLRFAAPLLRVVLCCIFRTPDSRFSVPPGIILPMLHGSLRDLDVVGCLRQALPYMDRSSIYHWSNLKAGATPTEFAYHFQLFIVLAQMSSRMDWATISEARNAAGHSRKRLDILVSNNGNRFGFELVADATEASLRAHYEDQAEIYFTAMGLS
jgi:hypothetical protein